MPLGCLVAKPKPREDSKKQGHGHGASFMAMLIKGLLQQQKFIRIQGGERFPDAGQLRRERHPSLLPALFLGVRGRCLCVSLFLTSLLGSSSASLSGLHLFPISTELAPQLFVGVFTRLRRKWAVGNQASFRGLQSSRLRLSRKKLLLHRVVLASCPTVRKSAQAVLQALHAEEVRRVRAMLHCHFVQGLPSFPHLCTLRATSFLSKRPLRSRELLLHLQLPLGDGL
mmetsp:Transcript_486/g.1767  ORF Transcript_486/g.1767 Transcript_486/m.1767 type:complete len:227 (-) Transcript_486:381-1061(-)